MRASSIGIIGGAHGPIAVYKTAMLARPVIIAAGLFVAVLSALGVWLFLKHK